MKTQQRNFIVEIKGKRRSAVPPKSIWGTTDISTLVREVKADAPHLFNSQDTKTGEAQPIRADAAPTKIEVDGDESWASQYAEPNASPSAEFDIGLMPDQDSSTPDQLSERGRIQKGEPRHLLIRKSKRTSAPASKAVEKEDKSEDELRLLYEENKRLVKALVETLRDENERLSTMLARFNVGE